MKVYKYRSGEDRDFESLLNNYFWSAAASELNDPSEAYVDDSFITKSLKLLNTEDLQSNFSSFIKMRHTVGVYSLSKTPFDELMWAYYASGHKGFCIEYDLHRLVREARTSWNFIDVSYRDKPQKIILKDFLSENEPLLMINKMIGTKSSRWKHEQEIRIVTTGSGKNNYAPDAVTGIYFGCRCDDKIIRDVREKLRGRNIKYYKIKFSDNSYSMNANVLDHHQELDGDRIDYQAPVEDAAIPELQSVKDHNKKYYKYLKMAIDIVRRDNSCKKIILADFSVDKIIDGRPVIYVHYETNIPTEFYAGLNVHFSINRHGNLEIIP